MPRHSAPAVAVLGLLLFTVAPARAVTRAPGAPSGDRAIGDTLTVVMRPILSVPEIVTDGADFTIEAMAPQSATEWSAQLTRDGATYPLSIGSVSYETAYERWFLTATVPPGVPEEMYDLVVSASGGLYDEVAHAVMVRRTVESDYYFVQITDTHLPTHKYYYQSGADTDTTEMEDLHEVIDDINLINPAFVVLTGDVVNEGELEDYLEKRYFTRAQRILRDLEVPVFVIAGNHDIGGWDDTPPPDGTARRNWWKFFGWRYLNDPSPGDGVHTQNYSFDYAGAHFAAMEAYNNYDRWRLYIYGDDSFTDGQLAWLVDDLSAVPPSVPTVLLYHMDFQDQIDLSALGVAGSLWGHVHYTSGDIGAHPFDLSTETVCDGERAMRLVRVSGSVVSPTEPISAGPSGGNLRVAYDAPNDGTATEITATVTNGQPQTFEHGRIRFEVDAASAPYQVDAGELVQTVVRGGVATCYVDIAFPAGSTTTVTISPKPGSGTPDGPEAGLSLTGPAFPNPARNGTQFGFVLTEPGRVRVTVYDTGGRRVATLAGHAARGLNRVAWDLRSDLGAGVASGVYLYRIEAGGECVSGKVVVVR